MVKSPGDDLLSLYKHNSEYIYVICKDCLFDKILAGFCENSLGHVERFNIDRMEWEELA